MDMAMGVRLAQSFFNKNNSGSYDRLVRLATLGQDMKWKKKLVEECTQRITGFGDGLWYWNSNLIIKTE